MLSFKLVLLINASGIASAKFTYTASQFDDAAAYLQDKFSKNDHDCEDDAIGRILLGDSSANCPGFATIYEEMNKSNDWDEVVEQVHQGTVSSSSSLLFVDDLNFPDGENCCDQYGCIINEYSDIYDPDMGESGTTLDVYVSEKTCIKDRVWRAIGLQQNFVADRYVSKDCLSDMDRLIRLSALDTAYHRVESINHTMPVSDSARALFIDYSDQNSAYEAACVDEGGIFKELNYRANCSAFDEDHLNFISFPSCQAQSCGEIDTAGLFTEFTLGTAAKLHSYPTRNLYWSCIGELHNGTDDVVNDYCTIQNTYLEENANVATAYKSLQATPGEASGLFAKTKAVTVSGTKTYRIACQKAGGTYAEVSASIFCKKVRKSFNTLQEETTFIASIIPMCVGIYCDHTSIDPNKHFEQFLIDDGDLDSDGEFQWTCVY